MGTGLDQSLYFDLIADARELGYNAVAISGGEPLLYGGLSGLLAHSRALGMITTVTTNGMLATERKMNELSGCISAIAISLDGTPDSHNAIRGHARAFTLLERNIEHVRAARIPFGFIFSLTMHNLHELEWVVSYAAQQGATLVQVHPLEETGRASKFMPMQSPDEHELAFAFLEVSRLREEHGAPNSLEIVLDVADRRQLLNFPDQAYASTINLESAGVRQLVSPLVVESDGRMVPLQYGFSDKYMVGNLSNTRLREAWPRWQSEGFQKLIALCRKLYAKEVAGKCDHSLPFFNWYEAVANMSLS